MKKFAFLISRYIPRFRLIPHSILIITFILFSTFFSTLIPHPCFSQSGVLSSDTLIDQSNKLDGQTVRFRGEIVGDIMTRGDHCWINVNDGSQAIGIYGLTEMVKSVKFVGDYKHTGDTVEVSGEFHKSCPQHGGELDIHVERLRIIQTGKNRGHPIMASKMYLAIILFLCTLMVLGLYLYRKKI